MGLDKMPPAAELQDVILELAAAKEIAEARGQDRDWAAREQSGSRDGIYHSWKLPNTRIGTTLLSSLMCL